eukprot:scaffold147790_cov29-Tisochrysis_lutea.AAC.6
MHKEVLAPAPPPRDPFPPSSYASRMGGGLGPDLSCKQARDLPIFHSLRPPPSPRSLSLPSPAAQDPATVTSDATNIRHRVLRPGPRKHTIATRTEHWP